MPDRLEIIWTIQQAIRKGRVRGVFEGLGFFEILSVGGVAVYVLLVLSIVSFGVVLERAWTYSRFSALVRDTQRLLEGVVTTEALRGKLAEAIAKAPGGTKAGQAGPSPLVNVLSAALARGDAAAAAVAAKERRRALELALRAEGASLQSYLGVLGTVGATAPFIGLFGTVLGIIRAFGDMAGDLARGPFAVADGISEALVATAAGLLVAIPAVITYNYFVRRSRTLCFYLERAVEDYMPLIEGGLAGAPAGGQAEAVEESEAKGEPSAAKP